MVERKKPARLPLARKVAKAARAAAAAATMAGAIAAAASPAMDEHPLAMLTPVATAEAPPPALLPYQQAWIADEAQLKICEKSRRTGFTWAEAADNVLIAAADRGSNVFYISATQDMAREYIEACAMWARAFDYAAGEIGEGLYDDGEAEDGSRRYIKTFEIVFPKSGRRITALSSRPTNLRGKQGVIVIDEAAFHQNLGELLKAAMAMLLWGDKVRIISTHNGAENPFAELINEVRAGKRGSATVHRVTFRDAVAQGLYQRVCLRKGIAWTAEAEAKWVSDAYGFYGEAANEELDVVPSQSAGAYLTLALIEQRMTGEKPPAGPALVRGRWADDFAWLSEDVRRHAIAGWLKEAVEPHLKNLHPDRRHVFGVDFARVRNLSVIVVLEEDVDLVWRPKLNIELFNCPFTCQEQILFEVIDAMPRFRGGAMDAGGNGSALAEKTAQKYGVEMVERVALNDPFYLAHMPKLKAGLEDGTLRDLPRDDQVRDDLRALKLIKGVAKLPAGNTATSAAAKAAAAEAGQKMQRHGDYAIAIFLAVYATKREAGEIAWMPAGNSDSYWGDRGDHDDGEDADFSRKLGW